MVLWGFYDILMVHCSKTISLNANAVIRIWLSLKLRESLEKTPIDTPYSKIDKETHYICAHLDFYKYVSGVVDARTRQMINGKYVVLTNIIWNDWSINKVTYQSTLVHKIVLITC